jgi:hypothetical protein
MIQPYDDEADLNPATDAHLRDVIASRVSRRSVLTGGAALAAGFFSSGLLAPAAQAAAPSHAKGRAKAGLLGFTPIPLGHGDEVVVPPGYSARPFIPWGTPLLGEYPDFVPGGNTADQQAQQLGMHHDGMHFFALHRGRKGSVHGLLVLNHEYVDEGYLQTGTLAVPPLSSWTPDMVGKSQNAHGVSVVEVKESGGEWEVVRGRYNRRITANTPMAFAGPAAGHRLLRTAADPAGRKPLGTFNNCAHGYTPWGTYLTCEENFNGYFRLEPGAYREEQTANQGRYGIGGDRNRWATHDRRFVVTPTEAHEPNRFGWVVEIDPFDPHSTPVKRTALGRLKHEGATTHVTKGGRVVVYMGDDQVNEYLYKFVSAGNWKDLLREQGRSPLDEGTLYVAKVNDDGTGKWLPLVHGSGPLTAANGFADQGEVLVKTRLAATALGATPMDRPEWTAVDPTTGTAYLTLTNNTSSAKVLNAANPRKPNVWGHIFGWNEAGGDHAATAFTWDLFLIAGQGRSSGDGSTIADEDAFGSPDGLWADPDGRLWIQTDGTQPAGAYDQMLAANPAVRDARGVPEVHRFFTGVTNGEVTGVVCTPDQRTMFVNIQHPGEGGGSTWPHTDGLTTPRSATVVITKDDGGVIGT